MPQTPHVDVVTHMTQGLGQPHVQAPKLCATDGSHIVASFELCATSKLTPTILGVKKDIVIVIVLLYMPCSSAVVVVQDKAMQRRAIDRH